MRGQPAWVDKVQDKQEQCIYDLCFNPDGTQLVVAAGHQVLVYETTGGALVQPLKGHKDTVYCVCYAKDGRRFASGSADKSVIIWTFKLEGILKYSHNEAVQAMQFNPVSHQLLSCSLSDIAFWSAEQKAVQKHKSGGRVNCCAWTLDGQYLAIGVATGYVSIRNKNGEEKTRIERQSGVPIWSLAWNPLRDDTADILCIAEWNGVISFYTINGKAVGKERTVHFTPLKITYFPDGQYILVSGSNKQCLLMTHDGIQLAVVGNTFSSWVWSCAVHPSSSHIALGCQDGTITYLQLSWNIVHGLYEDRYAYRENMTDVIIQHLVTNQKVRIKCKDLVCRIAVYRNRLAVQLPERVIIYEPSGSSEGMHYRIREKLNQTINCNLLVITTNHLVLCLERRLQCLSFTGIVEREWILDDLITYIKVVGGPAGQECLITGLKTGHVIKIYLDNPFPAHLAKVEGSVRCLDISSLKEKMAVVSETGVLSIFDLYTEEKLQDFQDVTSVAYNSASEDIMCFSGSNYLAIKVANFSEYRQKFSGFVVGHNGSKLYCLNGSAVIILEVPLSLFMYQYLDIGLFKEAYEVACLGVAESDWRALGIAALDNLELNIAYSAFARIKNLRYIEVVSEVEEKLKSGEWGQEACMAIAAAAMGRLRDAAKLYQKAGLQQYARDMYSDLRMFDIAQEFIASGNTQDRTILLRRRAEWAKSLGEPRAAAEMFFSAGDTQRAINIIAEYGWIDMLIKVGRQLDKSDRDNLSLIAKILKQLGATHGAAEIFSRLGDDPDVADVLIDAQAWPEAFELAERNPKLKSRVYGPYARWLAETGRFSEAQEAFQMAGQPEESVSVLTSLADNAIAEKRYRDACYFYWLLSQLSLNLLKNTEEIKTMYLSYYNKADVYYAYHEIHKYLDEPFTSLMPEALFNISRYLLLKTQSIQLEGVSKLKIMYTLIKQARLLGANKLVMQLLEQLRSMKISKNLLAQVETSTLAARAYPYRDPEELLPLCYKCSTFNPLLPVDYSIGSKCIQCGLKFQYSFVMFEILPLVEFELEEGITDQEAEKLIEEPLSLSSISTEDQLTVFSNETDLFTARLIKYEEKTDDSTVIVGRNVLKSMDPSTVLIVKWPKPFKTKYFRNLLPDLQVTLCKSCLKLFHSDDYELALLRHGHCPFCRTSQTSNIILHYTVSSWHVQELANYSESPSKQRPLLVLQNAEKSDILLEMFSIMLAVLFVIFSFVTGQFFDHNNTLMTNEVLEKISYNPYMIRQKKFFPFFSVIRFANSQCLASNSLNGTCFTRRECYNYGGTPSGTCANGLGICCVFQKTCGSTTNINNTYFINPGYPTTYKGGERCTITINKCNSGICQIRLDFIDFSFSQPNLNGTCDYDLFLITGAASSVPRICGENSNQHVYADFNEASPITISIGTNADYAFDRRWNIRIQQIACDSLWRAPNGCLQYYKSTSDTVTSFNYGTTVNSRSPEVGTREMVNLNYGICIRMALGYCSIQWSQSDINSFSISGDTSTLDPTIIGTSVVAESGLNCTDDFVIIPNPSENGIPDNTERFCGNAFTTKTSTLKPFVLYVVTNDNELNDAQNKGFKLTYRQLPCAV